MPIRYRRALPTDALQAWPDIRADWGLFRPALRRRVPQLLAELLANDRIFLCAFEDIETRRLLMLGGYGCLPLSFVEDGQECSGRTILEQALDAEVAARPVFMGPRQIAEANTRGALEVLNFMVVSAREGPRFLDEVAVVHNAWTFFVQGHRMNGLWHENGLPHVTEALLASGWHAVRTFSRSSGEQVSLLHLSATDPGAIMSGVTFSPPYARFGFTRREQRLLEYSLLDYSDQEVATFLELTPDAVKKRWRSIHAKVTAREPELLDGVSSATGRRKALLGRVRQSLEELRPFAPR
jgi:hypothetical protein